MKKLLLICCILISTTKIDAQNVGINGTAAVPDPSAMLDVAATNKGLLIPRVALTSTTDIVTIPSPLTSLLVYNTNAAMTGGAIGFYYYDGAKWQRVVSTNFLNSTSITAIGKFYVNGINIPNNTALTLTIADANCTAASQISASFAGLLPGTNGQNVNMRIANIQTTAGSIVFQLVNTSGIAMNGLSLAYTGFY